RRFSFEVKFEKRGEPTGPCSARWPIGIMSGSGQAPVVRKGVQLLSTANSASRADQLSQRSLTIRHILAFDATFDPFVVDVGPGDKLNTILRPLLTIAAW